MEKEQKTESALEEAQRLVKGPRNADYGHPLDDFKRIAALWQTILGFYVSAEQVGLCMIALKIAREVHKSRRDNRVDIAGYAETLEMISDERQRRSDGLVMDVLNLKKSAAKR